MQISVKTSSGKTISIDDLESSTTIGEVKQKIYEKEGIRKKRQRVLYEGRQLRDGDTIGEIGIENMGTLHLAEEYGELKAIFNPGRLGVDICVATGLVRSVREGSQAEQKGVFSEMVIHEIQGQPYSERLMKEKMAGSEDYELTFIFPQAEQLQTAETTKEGAPTSEANSPKEAKADAEPQAADEPKEEAKTAEDPQAAATPQEDARLVEELQASDVPMEEKLAIDVEPAEESKAAAEPQAAEAPEEEAKPAEDPAVAAEAPKEEKQVAEAELTLESTPAAEPLAADAPSEGVRPAEEPEAVEVLTEEKPGEAESTEESKVASESQADETPKEQAEDHEESDEAKAKRKSVVLQGLVQALKAIDDLRDVEQSCSAGLAKVALAIADTIPEHFRDDTTRTAMAAIAEAEEARRANEANKALRKISAGLIEAAQKAAGARMDAEREAARLEHERHERETRVQAEANEESDEDKAKRKSVVLQGLVQALKAIQDLGDVEQYCSAGLAKLALSIADTIPENFRDDTTRTAIAEAVIAEASSDGWRGNTHRSDGSDWSGHDRQYWKEDDDLDDNAIPDSQTVVAVYDFDPTSSDWPFQHQQPLALHTGLVIKIIHDDGGEWALGHPEGIPDQRGYFPKNYTVSRDFWEAAAAEYDKQAEESKAAVREAVASGPIAQNELPIEEAGPVEEPVKPKEDKPVAEAELMEEFKASAPVEPHEAEAYIEDQNAAEQAGAQTNEEADTEANAKAEAEEKAKAEAEAKAKAEAEAKAKAEAEEKAKAEAEAKAKAEAMKSAQGDVRRPSSQELLRSAYNENRESYLNRPNSAQHALKPLKPLAPPRGSPAWIYQEPKRFQGLREREAERNARKALRLTYRGVLRSAGHNVGVVTPSIPTTIDSDPPPRFEPPPLSTVWRPAPSHVPVDKPPSLLSKPFRSNRSTSLEAPVAHYLVDDRAIILGERTKLKKDTWRTLQGWSRCCKGSPWTLKQVYSEIEADVHHYKAKDTRAMRGRLPPELLGLSTTQDRRHRHPFTRFPGFQHESKSSGMQSSSSLPALVDTSTSDS